MNATFCHLGIRHDSSQQINLEAPSGAELHYNRLEFCVASQ